MTLETQIIEQRIEKIDSNPATPYQKLLDKYTQPPYLLQNYGVVSIESDKIYITTDLCPSSQKGYEREFYQKLIKHYPNPVEITLLVSGKWIDKHPQAFQELKKWEDQQRLSITWETTPIHTPTILKPLLQTTFCYPKVSIWQKNFWMSRKNSSNKALLPLSFFVFQGLSKMKKRYKHSNDWD